MTLTAESESRFAELTKLESGWFDGRGVPMDPRCTDAAKRVCALIEAFASVRIYPDTLDLSGGYHLEFDTDNRSRADFSVEIVLSGESVTALCHCMVGATGADSADLDIATQWDDLAAFLADHGEPMVWGEPRYQSPAPSNPLPLH